MSAPPVVTHRVTPCASGVAGVADGYSAFSCAEPDVTPDAGAVTADRVPAPDLGARQCSDKGHYANTEPVVPAIAELAQLDQWVIWKPIHGQKVPLKRDDRGDKPRLIGASHSEPADWTSYASASASQAELRGQGIGFVFSDYDPYSGIDLDGCRDPKTGIIADWAWRWIRALASYSEISPSQTGVKIFARGTLPEQLLHAFGPHIGIEVYSTKRFFTITGQHLEGTPTNIREAQYALDLMWAEYHVEPPPAAPRKEYKVSKGEAAAGRITSREAREKINNSNNLGDYLEHHGAKLIRTRGDSRYYTGLASDQHNNGQTYIVSVATKGGGHKGFSYSPNGKLSKTDFPHGFDFFAAYVALEYGSDTEEHRVAALKELNPIQPLQRQPEAAQPATEYRTAIQVADAARKRAQRLAARQERIARIDPLVGKIDQDTAIRAFDRDLFAYHLLCWANGPEHYASIERITRAVLQLDRAPAKHEIRRVKLSHGRLIAEGYIKRTIRGSKTRKETNCWQPGDGHRVIAIPDAPITLIESSTDSTPYQIGACEGGGIPPACENVYADSPEAWQWAADDHSAGELTALELALAVEPGVVTTMPPERRALVEQLSQADDATFASWYASHAPPAASATFDDSDQPEAGIFNAVEPPSHKPYSGRSRQHLSNAERYALVWESMRRRPEADESDPPEQLLLDTASNSALVRGLPPPAQRDKLAPLDRYLVELVRMSESELAGALKKHRATLKKHSGAVWLVGIRDRLALVEAEIDTRGSPPASQRPRSHAPGVGVQQALL